MHINKHILNNGLCLVHSEDKSTQMVAVNTLYDVGAKDENTNKTGLAHLFEHLMFGGTKNTPDFDRVIQKAGGESNAWTNNDLTNYYISIPYQNAETAIFLEADRMAGLDFSQKNLDNQKQVVIEEFKQRNLNQPYGDVSMLIRKMAYQVHPYNWCTIGKEISHIESITLEDIESFFFEHYYPNNAILSITGNISFKKAISITEKHFNQISFKNKKTRNLPTEPKQKEARFVETEKNVPLDAFYRVYKMCKRTDQEYHCTDLISDLLSNGSSSRLQQSLVKEKKMASEVNAYISGDIDNGLFYVKAKPTNGYDLKDIAFEIENQIEKLITDSISETELEKVKNKFESNKIFTEMNYLNKASNLAYFELIDTAENINKEIEKYRVIDTHQIKDTAKKLFDKQQSSTLFYRAKKES